MAAPVWLDTYGLTGQLLGHKRWAETNRPGIRYVRLSNATVRVRVMGSGSRTVVFAADPPCGIEHFDMLFERLSPTMRVVCFEQPGFGFSTPHRTFRFTPTDYATTLRELLHTLGPGPYTLAFECMGVYGALSVAAVEPTLIDRLFLMQAPAWSEQRKWVETVDPRNILRRPFVGQLIMPFLRHKLTDIWYKIALNDQALLPAFAAPAHECYHHKAGYCLASLLNVWYNTPTFSVETVTQPALVVWGNGDKSHRKTDKQSTLTYLTNAKYEEWDDAGHFPELEQPDRFIQKLTHLLRA